MARFEIDNSEMATMGGENNADTFCEMGLMYATGRGCDVDLSLRTSGSTSPPSRAAIAPPSFAPMSPPRSARWSSRLPFAQLANG